MKQKYNNFNKYKIWECISLNKKNPFEHWEWDKYWTWCCETNKRPRTLSVCSVAPLKAVGASSVGGSPAWEPAPATKLLQLMRKLSSVKVFEPSTNTTDSGLWSKRTSLCSLRLGHDLRNYIMQIWAFRFNKTP